MSVRTNLRTAIKAKLLTIKTSNGYNSTVAQVYDPPQDIERMVDFPSINIYWDKEDRIDREIQGNNQLYNLRMVAQLYCILHDTNDLPLAQDKLLADIQRMVGNNHYVPDANGNATAFNVVYLGATPYGPAEGTPNGGIIVEVEIFYSVNVKNPDVMIHG